MSSTYMAFVQLLALFSTLKGLGSLYFLLDGFAGFPAATYPACVLVRG